MHREVLSCVTVQCCMCGSDAAVSLYVQICEGQKV